VTDGHHDVHAVEPEVSILLHVSPDVVGEFVTGDHGTDDCPMPLVQGMVATRTPGVIDRPSAGNADKGCAPFPASPTR
jgi:hypothetical protein